MGGGPRKHREDTEKTKQSADPPNDKGFPRWLRW